MNIPLGPATGCLRDAEQICAIQVVLAQLPIGALIVILSHYLSVPWFNVYALG